MDLPEMKDSSIDKRGSLPFFCGTERTTREVKTGEVRIRERITKELVAPAAMEAGTMMIFRISTIENADIDKKLLVAMIYHFFSAWLLYHLTYTTNCCLTLCCTLFQPGPQANIPYAWIRNICCFS